MTDYADAAPKPAVAATNVADLLRARADEYGASTALVDGSAKITWRTLDTQVDNLARAMSALGLVGGHRVALAMTNGAPMVTAYLAVLRAGMVAVPINPTSTPNEISRVLADSGSRLCFADAQTVESVRVAVAETAVPVIVNGAETQPGETAYDDLPEGSSTVVTPRDTESLAVLLYTSGTSGRPRAAMLSHRALLANIVQAASTDPPPVQPDDVVLGVLPLCHVYGLNAVLGQVLLTGATLVVGKRFDAAETLSLIGSEGITCLPVAPPVIGAWLAQDGIGDRLAGVRTLLSGAGPLAEDIVREFESRTGHAVEQGYGLTEASPIVTSTVGTPTHKPGSAGRALPGVELRIVDDSASGARDAEPDDPGEIWVRGDNVLEGYWPDGDGGPDDDGWLHTGDIGFVDHDGDLFLVDRLRNSSSSRASMSTHRRSKT